MAGLLVAVGRPFLPVPTDELEDADAGRTPSIGGLETVPVLVALAMFEETAGRAVRPAAVVEVVAADRGVRPPGAIDCLGRPAAAVDGEGADDVLAAEVAVLAASRLAAVGPDARTEAVEAWTFAGRAALGASEERTGGLETVGLAGDADVVVCLAAALEAVEAVEAVAPSGLRAVPVVKGVRAAGTPLRVAAALVRKARLGWRERFLEWRFALDFLSFAVPLG